MNSSCRVMEAGNGLPFICVHSALLTVSRVLSHSSRHYVRKTFADGPLSAPLIPLPGLSRVTDSLLTYLLTYKNTQ